MGLTPKLRILVVEDHPDTLHLYRKLLEDEGHDVVAVDSFASAVELVGTDNFDLVISDVSLGDGSGWALLERLRERNPGLPGIAVSGHAYPTDIAKSERAGYCVHLSKPVDPERLYDAIRVCTEVTQNN